MLLPEPPPPQATLFDSQLTEGSHGCMCDRVPSIVLSGEGERSCCGDGDRAGDGEQSLQGESMAKVGPGGVGTGLAMGPGLHRDTVWLLLG